MADLQAQIQQAKQAGYSDDEVLSYLSSKRSDLAPKIQQAQKAGYGAGDIVSHLSGNAAPQQPQQDIFEKAVNYHTGNTLIDAPLGLLQGAAKGAASTGVGIGQIYRKVTGQAPLPESTYAADTVPNGIGQGTGKFLEQAAEFAIPAGMAGKAVKGAGLLARAGTQAAVGAGVGAAQSGGDPTSTVIGGVLGGAGEAIPAAVSGVKKLIGNKAPNLTNFSESFGGATPTQKARISQALGTLQKDGIKPGSDVHEMQDAIKGKLQDLGQAYQNLDPAIAQRTQPVGDVVQKLQDAQKSFMQKGVVTDKAGYNAIQDQIDTVEQIAEQNGGHIQLDDLLHLKQIANGKTNFQSSDLDKLVWNKIGNAYRSTADALAPETTPLNKDYQKYKDLEQIIDQNIARGKGTTPSGLDVLKNKVMQHSVGAAAGAQLVHAAAGPAGAAAGGVLGGIVGPKLAKSAAQILQNAIDNGTFSKLPAVRQQMIAAASKMGDSVAVLKLLGQGTTQKSTQSLVAQGAQ